MVTCLVTGGAGFIGSHLVEALLQKGAVVRVLDNLTSGSSANLSRVRDAIEMYQGDLTDLTLVRRAIKNAEVVFHLASTEPFIPGTPGRGDHPDVAATRELLIAAREASVRRVVYASSLRVYGYMAGGVCNEERALCSMQPVSPEGHVKLLGEEACLAFTRRYGLDTVRLRYSNVFGPRQPANCPYSAVVRQTLASMLAGQAPVLDDHGLVGRDLVSVGDAVHAALIAAGAPRVSGKAYNVGRGRPTSGRELVAALNSILGTRIEPTFTRPRRLNDIDNLPNLWGAEIGLGYCAGEDLIRGLRSCVEAAVGWRGRPHLRPVHIAREGLPARRIP